MGEGLIVRRGGGGAKSEETYAWRKKVAIDDAFLGFVVDDNENAYPDGGTQNNRYYKKVVVDTSPIQYTYTGSSTLSTGVDSDGNPTWELKLLTSGTLNIKEMLTPIQDVFLVGGGGGGGYGISGGGGGGGYTYTALNFDTPFGVDKQVIIGAGGVGGTNSSIPATDGGDTSIFGLTAAGGKAGDSIGGSGGSGGGGCEGSSGGTGQGTTTRAFGETTGTLYAGGGGGGYNRYRSSIYQGGNGGSDGSAGGSSSESGSSSDLIGGDGGDGGGGDAAIRSGLQITRQSVAGEVNTGGGGAGGSYRRDTSNSDATIGNGMSGGSGIIILRGRYA